MASEDAQLACDLIHDALKARLDDSVRRSLTAAANEVAASVQNNKKTLSDVDDCISEMEQNLRGLNYKASAPRPSSKKGKVHPEDSFAKFFRLLRVTLREGTAEGPALSEPPKFSGFSDTAQKKKDRRLLQQELTNRLRHGDYTSKDLVELLQKTREISELAALQAQQCGDDDESSVCLLPLLSPIPYSHHVS